MSPMGSSGSSLTLPKQCLHSRVPGGFSSDPVRGSPGRFGLRGTEFSLIFTVLGDTYLRPSAAKWGVASSNAVKQYCFGTFLPLASRWSLGDSGWLWVPPGSKIPRSQDNTARRCSSGARPCTTACPCSSSSGSPATRLQAVHSKISGMCRKPPQPEFPPGRKPG